MMRHDIKGEFVWNVLCTMLLGYVKVFATFRPSLKDRLLLIITIVLHDIYVTMRPQIPLRATCFSLSFSCAFSSTSSHNVLSTYRSSNKASALRKQQNS